MTVPAMLELSGDPRARGRAQALHRLGGLPGARWRRLRRVGAAAETTRSVMKVAPAGQW